MSHDIEGTRMAYAGAMPWHKIGTRVGDLPMDADTLLDAAQADFTVVRYPVAAIDPDTGEVLRTPEGEPVLIPGGNATVRHDIDGSLDGLAPVGDGYTVMQNRTVLEQALNVIGAAQNEFVVDTVFVLDGGRKFGASIDLGTLVIDPDGVNDTIARNLLVYSGHDGKTALKYANTDVRAVCQNTVTMGLNSARRVFSARHTANIDDRIQEARSVLGMSVEWGEAFAKTAYRLLGTPVTPVTVDRFIGKVFPKKSDETDRQRRNREAEGETLRAVLANPKNFAAVGENAWGLWNGYVEYIDHHRVGSAAKQTEIILNDASVWTKRKVDAADWLLATV